MIRLLLLAISLGCLGCTAISSQSGTEFNSVPRDTKYVIHDLDIVAEPFEQWINNDFTPISPLTAYRVEDNANGDWTSWNKFWFASAIGGQLGDLLSTDAAIDRGCREGNPLFGSAPNIAVMALVKTGILGAVYLVDEYLLDGDPRRQDFRNWSYGALAVTGLAAAGWNAAQDCR